ncbi:MAG: ribonuclease E/G [Planctomycetia bacterium]
MNALTPPDPTGEEGHDAPSDGGDMARGGGQRAGGRHRRRRRGRRRHGPATSADAAFPGTDGPGSLGPEEDAPPPPLDDPDAPAPMDAPPAWPVPGAPSLLDDDAEPGPAPEGDGSADSGERGRRRRRGGRGRRRREGLAPAGEGEGAGLPPDPDAPPPPEGEAGSSEPAEGERGPARARGRRSREREERRLRRDQRRRERGGSRPVHEDDLVEVHAKGLPAPVEGETEAEAKGPTQPVTKTLLVNAAEPEEVRIALLEDGQLEEIYLETGHERSVAGNIYRGRVQNVERGIGAAFVDLGRGVMGFLHVTDLPDRPAPAEGDAVTAPLQPGQEIMVQITRDSMGRKGPALTGRVSLPGRYLVLTPNSDRSGVSRRIDRGSERDRMRKLLRDLEVPEGMGIIVRTAGESQPLGLLRADLKHLLAEWEALKARAAEPGAPGLLRGESDVAERCVRDIMPADVSRVIVDDVRMAERIRHLVGVWYPQDLPPEALVLAPALDGPDPDAPLPEEAPEVVEPAAPALETDHEAQSAPHLPPADDGFADGLVEGPPAGASLPPLPEDGSDEPPPEDEHALAPEADVEPPPAPPALPKPPEVEVWNDPMPLLHAQGVETQLEDVLRRTVRLPSGGSIVVDTTEALVAIDVNSGRLTDEEDPERTALVTNLEAVAVVTRQLRLRDLGGLIVIDFIDMRDRKDIRKVEHALQRALQRDRARIRVDRIGPFGCVMLSRQRIRQAVFRVTSEDCAACAGTGRRRLLSGQALRVLREIQARVARSRGRGGVEVRAPGAVVEWLNKHRPNALRDLRSVCTGPVRLEVDGKLPPDGWAMRGLAPDGPVAARPGAAPKGPARPA